MSLHEDLAIKAISLGHTAERLHRAAQTKANSTWFFLIVAGVVWYFSTWIWALIPLAIGAFTAVQSVSATLTAHHMERLEKK